MAIDHVCDMEVDEHTAPARSDFAGDRYYFCSQECKLKFDADPNKYVSRTESGQT